MGPARLYLSVMVMSDPRPPVEDVTHDTWRIFAAVPANPAVRQVMQDIQNTFASERWPLRWVDPKLAHITLRFFGDTLLTDIPGIESQLAEIATRHRWFTLRTAGIGAFPSWSRPRVIWLGLSGGSRRLEAIIREVEMLGSDVQALASRDKGKPFRAHITLARLRDNALVPHDFSQALTAIDLEPVELAVDHIQLIRSVLGPKGPTYTTI